ncbi:MAG: hypothetical protein AAGC60_03450 [Acidobacteriota bacterium]
MKRLLILSSLIFLVVSPTWAADPAAAVLTATGAALPSAPDWALDQGGCQLPDLEGLSEEEARARVEAAGMEITDAAAPACPVSFSCNSLTNCAAGSLCSITDIGRCCTTGGGLGLCCAMGTIKVKRCPCRCTGPACLLSCVQSADVKWGCR